MRLPVFLFFISALFAAAAPSRPVPSAQARPNILFILIDDMGWMDLVCQGNPHLHTPHVDAFAKEGMRFTDAYAPAPVCSPTRAAIMTGQSPARLHITNHLPHQDRFTPEESKLLPAEMLDHLPLEHVTIAERLKGDGGYATAFIGKWHLYKTPPTTVPTAEWGTAGRCVPTRDTSTREGFASRSLSDGRAR